ncbi:MAG: insulinase family protein [Candidatus Dadabacteria bacterium]|nr:insulinase family protein [Candidatus Dadabacteria bacterium]
MKGVFKLLFLFILITGASLMSLNAQTFAVVEGVTKYSLSNGMTVLLERNDSSPVVAVNVWVKTGSACEVEGEYGLAHVHEHMLFKGTEGRRVGEIAGMVEAGGGDINAFTSFDETVYYIVSARRFLPMALDVLSDVMENSTFDPAELEKELEVVQEEIRRGEDSPSRVISQKLFSTAYSVHPYGRPIIGTKQSVGSFTRDGILDFYRKWYSPDNMILVVVGDFDPEGIKDAVARTFGKIKKRKTPECKLPPEPEQKRTRTFVIGRDVNTGYFSFAFHTPSASHADTPVLDVISGILGTGESSRLYRKLKEQNATVNDIYAYAYSLKENGLFLVGGVFDPGKVEKASKEIVAEIELIKNEPVGAEELARAKTNIERDFIRAKETMQGQARKLGYFELETGDYGYERLYLERVRNVTPEDILRVAREYFKQKNLTAGVLLPKDKTKGVEKGFRKALVFPGATQEKEKKKASSTQAEFKKYELSNGIRVLLKRNPAVPLFSVHAAFLGGLRYEDENTNGISNFMSGMFTRGTSSRSAEDIATQIEGLGGTVDGFSGKNSVGVTLSALSENFEGAMDIFSDVILDPSFSDKEMERERREILAALEKQKDNLTGKAVRNFLRTLFLKHPYRFNVLGTEENVDGFTSADVREFYKKVIRPENMVISVAGDIDAEKTPALLEKLFGSMKQGVFEKIRPPRESALSAAREIVEFERDKAQTHIIAGFHAPGFKSRDRYAFEVLNSVLSGQGGRLFIELRDKKSLAYAVTSFYVPGMEGGYFGVYIGTAPQKEKEALGAIKEQLQLALEGIGEHELERAKNYIVGSFEIGLQRNSAQASTVGFDELYGIGTYEYRKFPEKILSVTADDVARVARKYINPETAAVSILKPEGDSTENR